MTQTDHESDVRAWLVLNVYSAIFPAAVLFLASIAGAVQPDATSSASGSSLVEPAYETLVSLSRYSPLLVVAFSILMATVGDLYFHRLWPTPREFIILVLYGSLLTAAIGIGTVTSYEESSSADNWIHLFQWILLQAGFTVLIVHYCAGLQLDVRREHLARMRTLEKKLADLQGRPKNE